FPKELSAFETEDAAPEPVEVYRNDGHIQSLGDLLQPALERKQIAGPADGALSEDADHVSGFQLLPSASDRLHHVPAPARADRNRVRQPKEPVERLQLVVRSPHHEADEALHAR